MTKEHKCVCGLGQLPINNYFRQQLSSIKHNICWCCLGQLPINKYFTQQFTIIVCDTFICLSYVICVYVYIYIERETYSCVYVCIYMYILDVYIYIYIYTYIHTCIHTYVDFLVRGGPAGRRPRGLLSRGRALGRAGKHMCRYMYVCIYIYIYM